MNENKKYMCCTKLKMKLDLSKIEILMKTKCEKAMIRFYTF